MKRHPAVLSLLTLLLASGVWADSIWNASSGDWNTAGNWSPSGVPTSSTTVIVGTTTSNRTATITSADAASYYGYIGYSSGNIGTVNVLNGRNWITGNLAVGYAGTGTLNISGGAMVVVYNSGYIGSNTGGNGNVTVTGAGSQLVNDSELSVGQSGTGKLTIADGGKVTDTYGNIGYFSASNGEVTVTGTSSLWQNNFGLNVGIYGIGKLTIADGGKVTTGAGVGTFLAYQSASTGTLNLNDTSGSRGVLETAYIYEGTGTGGGHLNFAGGILRATQNQSNFLQDFEAGDVQLNTGGAFLDSNGYNIGISTALEGAGGLTKQGAGTLTLTGASHYAGLTTLEEGTLLVNGSITSDVTVKAGAILGGNGSAGAVTIEHGGFLSPGDSGPGTLHTLSETWMGGGAYVWDITAPVGTPGAQWDFVSITGTLDIAAMTGDKFVIDIRGSLPGLAGFATYDWTILTASGGFGGTFAAGEFAFALDGFSSSTGGDFSILTSGNDLVLRYAAAPEPGRELLLLAGLGLVGRRRRR